MTEKRKSKKSNSDNPKTAELREAARGLLSLQAVISALSDAKPEKHSTVEFQSLRTALLGSEFLPDTKSGQIPFIFGSILKTGVSIVDRRGVFHTEYYLPGKHEAVRGSTKVPLDGMKAPKNLKDDPLWWWKSPHRLELSLCLERAVMQRFQGHAEFLVRSEAQRAALEARQSFDRAMRKFEELGADSSGTFSKCVSIFGEYGIEVMKLPPHFESAQLDSDSNWVPFNPFG